MNLHEVFVIGRFLFAFKLVLDNLVVFNAGGVFHFLGHLGCLSLVSFKVKFAEKGSHFELVFERPNFLIRD